MTEPERKGFDSSENIAYIHQDKGGRQPPGGDDLDARIKVLEYRAEQADKMFARIDSKLDAIVKDVSEVKGRINAMPTTWQLLGMILAIMGASFAIIRFGLAGL